MDCLPLRLQNYEHIDQRICCVTGSERKRCEAHGLWTWPRQNVAVLIYQDEDVVYRYVNKTAAVAGDEIGSIRIGHIEADTDVLRIGRL